MHLYIIGFLVTLPHIYKTGLTAEYSAILYKDRALHLYQAGFLDHSAILIQKMVDRALCHRIQNRVDRALLSYSTNFSDYSAILIQNRLDRVLCYNTTQNRVNRALHLCITSFEDHSAILPQNRLDRVLCHICFFSKCGRLLCQAYTELTLSPACNNIIGKWQIMRKRRNKSHLFSKKYNLQDCIFCHCLLSFTLELELCYNLRKETICI